MSLPVGGYKAFFQNLVIPLWGLLVCSGMCQLYRYENTSGTIASAPEYYPNYASTAGIRALPILMVFIHPQCPCSNATLGELERLVARLDSKLLVNVVFSRPEGAVADWHKTVLWSKACSIPSVKVVDDIDCIVTRRFGVTTSGQALLYDTRGRLRFSGGITAARGHAGDNVGSDVVLSMVRGEDSVTGSSCAGCDVFGCPVFEGGLQASMSESEQ